MKLATLCYVIDKPQNKTLMLHRVKKENDYHEGKWNGLGGKLELGESPEDCVIREIKEEAGLAIKSPHLHGFITFPNFDEVDDWYVFIFTADEFEGTSLNLWDGDKIFLEWLFQEKFFSAKFIYEKGEYKSHTVNFY